MWRHVDALYRIFDHLRKRFPNVIFQNCAGGGGRLDLGIMSRFHNTELTDWLRGPRDLKILNGMTWLLPPEILLLMFGTEFSDPAIDGDLDFQLRKVMLSRPIFRGISPSLSEFNAVLKDDVKENVQLFKKTVRPIMANSRVYHHTPFALALDPAPWVVLEYATQDEPKAVASFFRTDVAVDPLFEFIPRGLDPARTYKVTFRNRKHTVDIAGAQLMLQGLPIRLEGNMISEMVLFEAK